MKERTDSKVAPIYFLTNEYSSVVIICMFSDIFNDIEGYQLLIGFVTSDLCNFIGTAVQRQ